MKDTPVVLLMMAGLLIAAVGVGLKGLLSFEMITILTTVAGLSMFVAGTLEGST